MKSQLKNSKPQIYEVATKKILPNFNEEAKKFSYAKYFFNVARTAPGPAQSSL